MSLTDEKINDVFHSFDEDGNGVLRGSELDNALKCLRIDLTTADFSETFEGELQEQYTEEEFRNLVLTIPDRDFKRECFEALKEFCNEDSDSLSFDQIRKILTQMGNDQLDDDVVEELITELRTFDNKRPLRGQLRSPESCGEISVLRQVLDMILPTKH